MQLQLVPNVDTKARPKAAAGAVIMALLFIQHVRYEIQFVVAVSALINSNLGKMITNTKSSEKTNNRCNAFHKTINCQAT